MKINIILTCLILSTFEVSVVCGQDSGPANKVESFNGLFGLQVGIPTNAMKEAIENNMGNGGIGAGLILLSNPGTWGAKKKINTPLRLGVEAGYTYYGRFISDITINGYEGEYKTSYGVFQLNALFQVRPRIAEKITPFIELLAGGSFYMSRIKENLDFLDTGVDIDFTTAAYDLENYSSGSFNKGIALGCYIGNPRNTNGGNLALRISYNRGGEISYLVRNSVVYDPANDRLGYEVGTARANYLLVQVGVGF